jgi:flagellar hook protein FlgE
VSNWNLPNHSPQLLLNCGSPSSQGGTGLDGVTQFAGPSETISLLQDGTPAGVRTDLTLTHRGEVIASFSTGVSRVMGTFAVANFPAPQSLYLGPDRVLAETAASGPPLVSPVSEVSGLMLIPRALEQLPRKPNACSR